MSLLNIFGGASNNLFDYIRQYPGRVKEEATGAMEMMVDPRSRLLAASRLAYSPVAPFFEDVYTQAGEVLAPGINQQQQMMVDLQNQIRVLQGQPPVEYEPITGEQLTQPIAIAGSLMRGKFPNWVSPSQRAITAAQPKATGQQYAKALEKEKGAVAEARETGLLTALQDTPGTITQEQALSMVSPLDLTETIKGGSESTAKIIGTDLAGRPRYDWRGAQVFHFTDDKSANDIANYGYQVVGDGYYGEAVSFTNNEHYGSQFGGKQTVARISDDANIVETNDPRVSEVLSDRNLLPNKGSDERQTWRDRFLELGIDGVYDPGAGDLFIYNTDMVGYVGSEVVGTKYGRDQTLNLPGGTNPKEILVQLPEKVSPTDAEASAMALKMFGRDIEELSFSELNQITDRKFDTYTGGHWSEPNVLTHIRTNERDVGGKKALHAEEYQSDWHQQGQKIGYRTTRYEVFHPDTEEIVLRTDDRDAVEEMLAEDPDLNLDWDEAKDDPKVPDAPFKKNWHELGWKRHFMEAIRDPSIERLTWTTGDVQADRYNLAKYIDLIEAVPMVGGANIPAENFNLAVKYKEGNVERLQNISPDKLADYVGKEMADKIIQDAEKGQLKTYSGLDLEVGGEFHKNLYDKKIPQFVKKFLKQFGVEPQRISDENLKHLQMILDDEKRQLKIASRNFPNMSPEELIEASEIRSKIERINERIKSPGTLWYIDITPEMREHFSEQGIPLTMRQKGLLPEQGVGLLA